MISFFRASRSNVVVWVILGLLVVGLAGFGISTGGGGGRTVAAVGDSTIEVDDLSRTLDQELRTISQQIGRALPMSEARQFGVDRMVLARMINDATLDEEARRLGLSTGDETVQRLVLATPGFRGPTGEFDRQAYAFALERTGLTPVQFERVLRAEATREMIAGSVQSAVAMPEAAARTLLDFAAEQRRFEWIALDDALLEDPAPEPTEAELAAFHAANPVRYTRPETRRLTYVALEPETLAATLDVPEADLRSAYDAAGDRFAEPERRIVDRIGFATSDEAAAARASIEAGETDFDALAADRGLDATEIDQGEVTRTGLAAPTAEAVFGSEGPGLVGPVDTPLGPSLFRINAILPAKTTPFETARETLRTERALSLAADRIAAEAAPLQDLLVGGARLEEIAAETDFVLGTLALDAATTGGLADDPVFRTLAGEAEPGIETDLVSLTSGGLAAVRLEAIDPPALIPLVEIRDTVAADWRAAENALRVADLAGSLKAELDGGLSMTDLAARLDRPLIPAGALVRTDLLPEAPSGLVPAIFTAGPDGVVIATDGGAVALARLTEITPFDPDAPEAAGLPDQITGQLRAEAADDALALLLQALQAEAGVSVNQNLLDQVLARFP